VATVVRVGLPDRDVLAGLTAQDDRDRVPVVGRADDQHVDILANYSHKTPTRDELVVARVIGLANPGSFR
jgi:hypothetical protein